MRLRLRRGRAGGLRLLRRCRLSALDRHVRVGAVRQLWELGTARALSAKGGPRQASEADSYVVFPCVCR